MDQHNKPRFDNQTPSGYASDMSSQQPPVQAGFSDEYLASLQYNNQKFDLPWYDTAGGYMLIVGVILAVVMGGICVCSILLALI